MTAVVIAIAAAAAAAAAAAIGRRVRARQSAEQSRRSDGTLVPRQHAHRVVENTPHQPQSGFNVFINTVHLRPPGDQRMRKRDKIHDWSETTD